MAQTTHPYCELRLDENPFHSVLSQPWCMIVMGGLLVRLHPDGLQRMRLKFFVTALLFREGGLLWPDDTTLEAVMDASNSSVSDAITMVVTYGNGEPVALPIPLVCQL